MTVFGKLLVFMNLVFSVLTGALIVFVFTTRANWQSAYEDAKKKAEAAEVAYKNEKLAHDNDLKQKDAAAEAVIAQTKLVRDELASVQSENERLVKIAEDQRKLNTNSSTSEKQVAAELAQIKSERDLIVKEKEDLRTRLINIQKELDSQRGVAIAADLRSANLVQRNNNLLREVETITQRLRELETTAVVGGGSSTSGGNSIVNGAQRSAPANVRGKVTGVGGNGTLAQVDIGSDSGLSSGNVLTVYLGNEYKGDLLLTTVEAKKAVGKFTPAKRTSKIEEKDLVITSFGAGSGQ